MSEESIPRRAIPQFGRTEELRMMGFEAGATVHMSSLLFTLDELRTALFDSTMYQPRTLPFTVGEGVEVNVAVAMVRLVFTPHSIPKDEMGDEGYLLKEAPMAYWDRPDYYVEGWMIDAPAVFGGHRRRIRAYIMGISEGENDRLGTDCYVQIIPVNPDPHARIGYTEGPGY